MKKFVMIEDIGTWGYENGYKTINCTVKEKRFVADADTPEALKVTGSVEYCPDGTWHHFYVEPRRRAKNILGIR